MMNDELKACSYQFIVSRSAFTVCREMGGDFDMERLFYALKR